MKKNIIIILLTAFSLVSFAQRSEVGGMVGASYYIGDINPSEVFANPKLCAGFLYRYNLTPRWALRANILFGEATGSDLYTGYDRGLSFNTKYTEITVMTELNFFRIFNVPSRNRFSPYICAGFTLFSFNPTAQLNGEMYNLHALGTEGQGLAGGPEYYSLVSAAFPFGFGLKVNIGKRVSLGAEWGMRYTFTDYFDDVGGVYYGYDDLLEERGVIVAELSDPSIEKHVEGAARGNVTTTDLYHYTCFTFTFKIGNEDESCNIRYQYKPRPKVGRKR